MAPSSLILVAVLFAYAGVSSALFGSLFGGSTSDPIKPLPASYETLSAQEKQDLLWANIQKNPYTADKLPIVSSALLSSLQLFNVTFDQQAFSWVGDEMIVGRPKLVHTFGCVAKVELVIFSNATKYTGIFQKGGFGLARLSLASMDPFNFVPGMALKFLVNGKPSVNFHSMFSVDGQGSDRNFFSGVFTNRIAPAGTMATKAVGKKFDIAVATMPGNSCAHPPNGTHLPTVEQASVSQDGTKVSGAPVYPPVLMYHPNPAVGSPSDNTDDFRVPLGKIAPNSVLYTLAVHGHFDTKEEYIGQIVTRSNCIASNYGDTKLYFRHHPTFCNTPAEVGFPN